MDAYGKGVTLDTTNPLVRAMRFYKRSGFGGGREAPSSFGMELLTYRKEL